MDILEQVLRWVQSGSTSFKPESESIEDEEKFQDIAEALIHACEIGYLRNCHPLRESVSGRGFYVLVIVGGITYPGKQYLAGIDRKTRTMPDVIPETLFGLPTSGDTTVDSLLRVAIESFRKNDPASRQSAVEKLWDAWERLKTLLDDDPSKGNKALLNCSADEPNFRKLLEDEATRLHKIGNEFHIRHFKTGTTEITRVEQYDYLFHRLLALMNLLLVSMRKT